MESVGKKGQEKKRGKGGDEKKVDRARDPWHLVCVDTSTKARSA